MRSASSALPIWSSAIKLDMHTSSVIGDPLFLCFKKDDPFAVVLTAPIIILSKGREKEETGQKGRKEEAKTAPMQMNF